MSTAKAQGVHGYDWTPFAFYHDLPVTRPIGNRQIMSFLLAICFIAAGGAGTVVGVVVTRRALQQHQWRKVQGKVVAGRIASTGETTFAARITFEYVVDDISFTGSLVRTGAVEVNWRGPAKKTLSRYPIGSEVTVFVDPSNFGSAVLEPGGSAANQIIAGIFAIVLVIGLAAVLIDQF
jgi:uncharacterized protein DUF3592